MSLSNKYGISQETVNQMVKDGVISCSWPMYEEVFNLYQSMLSSGKNKTQIYNEIADRKGISERTVRDIISKVK